MGVARAISRFHRPTPQEIQRLVVNPEPALLTGLLDHWPAIERWTPAFLRASHGESRVTALVELPVTGVTLPGGQAAYERDMRLTDFLDLMQRTPPDRPCYVAYTRATDLLPSLQDDYDFTPMTGGRPAGETNTRLWIGSGGTRSMLHSDLKDNFFGQIYGRKAVTLIPFEQFHLLHPFRDSLVISQVDPDRPDYARFPRFRKVTPWVATVGPGDLLYIPRGCWHYFRSLEPSISINHWFGPPLSFRNYLRPLLKLGPPYWLTTLRDFVRHGVLQKPYHGELFFGPPPFGKRLFDLVTRGNFSLENDPTRE